MYIVVSRSREIHASEGSAFADVRYAVNVYIIWSLRGAGPLLHGLKKATPSDVRMLMTSSLTRRGLGEGGESNRLVPVSYTHLTLPTICSV